MDWLNDFLINYGYWGMLFSSFIAGSVFPFSSEAVMLAFIASGLAPAQLVVYATIGNTAGSMFNYGIGRLGKPEWIERFLRVKPSSLEKAQRFMAGHGAWMGFFAFLPILGSAISVVLGLMRANVVISTISIFLGKVLRYLIIAYGANFII